MVSCGIFARHRPDVVIVGQKDGSASSFEPLRLVSGDDLARRASDAPHAGTNPLVRMREDGWRS